MVQNTKKEEKLKEIRKKCQSELERGLQMVGMRSRDSAN